MTEIAKLCDPDLPDGVHLDLPAADYFGQDCIGSSDLVKLHRQHWGWWWSSRHSPKWKGLDTKALTYGSALHAILLEGVDAYEARFVPTPDPDDFDRLVVTIDDCKAALVEVGLDISDGTSKWKKPDWVRAMHDNLPDRHVWDAIMANYDLRRGVTELNPEGNFKPVTAVEDWQLRLLREVAISEGRADNHSIRKLFNDDHPALAEVSIFATVNGVRRRWRIDRMFPAFDMDLKSLGNWSGRPLPWAVGDTIARSGWDIQRADYFNGRAIAYQFLREGKLFGGSPAQRKWISSFPDKFPRYDWVWLVYQKPDFAAGRAPVIFPVWDDSWAPRVPGEPERPGDLRGFGQFKIDKALAFYKHAVATYGFDVPWAHVEETHYTDETNPRVFLPHWIQEDAPTDEAAYAGA